MTKPKFIKFSGVGKYFSLIKKLRTYFAGLTRRFLLKLLNPLDEF